MKREVRQKVWEMLGGKCAYCGKDIELKKMQIDHVVPLFRNDTDEQLKRMGIERGVDSMENYHPSCARCNRWKSTFTIEGFREQIQLQLERLRRDSSNYRMALDFELIEEKTEKVKFYFETIKG